MRTRALLVASLLGLCSCGARTEVLVPPAGDAGWDATPIVPERCDGMDQDLDGRIDEGLPLFPNGTITRVRTDEGSTGDCSRCSWSLTALVPTDRGMQVIMRVLTYGGAEPNVFARRTDGEGGPVEPWRTLLDEVSLDWFPSIAYRLDAPGLLVGTRSSTASWITTLDASGARIMGPQRIEPAGGPGTWITPQLTRLEDRTFLAAVECGTDVCLAHIDESGAHLDRWLLSERTRTEIAEVSPPVVTQHAGRVGLATIQIRGVSNSELLFFLLDEGGNTLREQRVELPQPDFEYLPVDTLRIVGGDDGFLVSFLRRDCEPVGRRGRWTARFDEEGNVVERPINHEPDSCYFGSDFHLQRRAAGGVVMSGTRKLERTTEVGPDESYVAHLDARGRLLWERAFDRVLHSVLERRDGRTFATLSDRWEHGEANCSGRRPAPLRAVNHKATLRARLVLPHRAGNESRT